MSTFVVVNTYTYAVTYVTDKLLTSIKTIVRLSGLSPDKLTNAVGCPGAWRDYVAPVPAISTNFTSRSMTPATDDLVGRWDFRDLLRLPGRRVVLGRSGRDQVPHSEARALARQLRVPDRCDYQARSTRCAGWSSTTLRSTDGFVKQGMGTAMNGSGLSTGTGYWRKAT